MKYAILLGLLLADCASRPKHTEVPTLRYAEKYISDAKDFNSRAIKSNMEIDSALDELLAETPEQ